MYFLQFLVVVFVTSGVVAVSVYMATGSIWTALVWTIIAMVLLQIGYFVLGFGLVNKRSKEETEANEDAALQPVKP
ncbi:MAG: exopolysaccharide production repressor protein, partial [Gemmatimonadaceae bacterium]